MLGVPLDGLGEDPALDVLPLALQGEGRVGVRGPGDVLLDDRTLVQIGRDVVGGGADELDTAVVRLVVGLGALEAGQEGVVNIYGTTAYFAN